MQIAAFKIEDFLGIDVFEATLDGASVEITGANGTGKSAALKALAEAFRSSGVDAELIRNGAKSGHVWLRLTKPNVEIDRTISATSNRVQVTVDGAKQSAPQRYLADLYGRPFGFNPVAFLDLTPQEQRDTLLGLIDIPIAREHVETIVGDDVSAAIDLHAVRLTGNGLTVLHDIAQRVYEKRREINVERKRLTGAIDQRSQNLPEIDTERFAGFDAAQAREKLADARVAINEQQGRVAALARAQDKYDDAKRQLQALEDQVQAKKREVEKLLEAGQAADEAVESYVEPDVAAIRSELEAYDEYQTHKATVEAVTADRERLVAVKRTHEELDRAYKRLSVEAPRELLKSANIPIEGLTISDTSILINDVPLGKRSQSEQIADCVAIAKALAGDLHVVFIDGIEGFDPAKFAAFKKATAGDGWQYIVTRVSSKPRKIERL